MASEYLIVGLDIGTTKVCVVIGKRSEAGELEIVGVGEAPSRGLRQGVVVNIEATVEAVCTATDAAEMMSGREISGVIAGIAGAHIEGINSRGVVAVTGRNREIDKDDVNRVIEAAKAIVIPMDREVLHVIPQEYIVDDQVGVKNPLDMIGIRLEAEVHIITGSVTSAQNLLKCVNRAGFRVDDIVLESLASSRAILSDDEMELGVLMIDLGGGTTDVLVYLDGSPYYTGGVVVGGRQITNDLSIMLKTPLEAAERLKREAGCCYLPMVNSEEEVVIPGVGSWPSTSIPRENICRIIQPRVTEILELVKEQMVRKDYLKHLGGGVVLSGGGSLLPGSVELAKEVFGLPARLGYPKSLGGVVAEYNSPVYATAVGLVLYGNELFSQDRGGRPSPVRSKGGLGGRFKDWMKEFF